MSTRPQAKPFLKWVGGKTRLLKVLSDLIPDDFRTYYEPFLGGGSLYFHLAQQGRFHHAILSDVNSELVNCYWVVRHRPDELMEHLAALPVQKEVFEELRGLQLQDLPPVRRAARMIYLNKTGFNGLYRVNKQGQFNVPWGSHDNPKVLDASNLLACSHVLNGATTLLEGDFVSASSSAESGDVVYFDPPYVPASSTANFKSYTKDGFTLGDQERLALHVRELAMKGVLVLVSNSDTPTVRELYDGFEFHVVRMRRNVSSKGDGRGPVNEVIVVARQPEDADPALGVPLHSEGAPA